MEYKKPTPIERVIRKVERVAAQKFGRTPLVIPPGFRGVTFCFDDFPLSAAQVAAPLLEEVGARGTFYTCFGTLNEESVGGKLADIETVKDLAARGHEIGCHTFDHVLCTGRNARHVALSCQKNRDFAARHGLVLKNFAYPQGEMSPQTKKIMKAHYQSARSIDRAINQGTCDAHALKAVPLYDTPEHELLRFVDDVAAQGGWLIFYTHDVSDFPKTYGTQTNLFKKIIRHTIIRNIPISPIGETIAQALKR